MHYLIFYTLFSDHIMCVESKLYNENRKKLLLIK